MSSLIGFAGRCYSGKSELAKICEEYGYNIISFGYPLKKLISDLLSVSIDDINRLKKVDSEYIFKDMDMMFISKETEIPYEYVKETIEGKTFKNTREIMQFIGTDLIRKYNNDWHVNRIKSMLDPNENYVFDDVRFPNERKMIEDLGGHCWFIVRPKMDCVSNHESETSLRWQEFDNVLVNDKDLGTLQLNWRLLMDIGHDSIIEEREEVINQIYGNKELINEIVSNEEPFVLLDTMFISKHEFDYNSEFLFRSDIFNENINELIEKTTNPLMLEDLKFFI